MAEKPPITVHLSLKLSDKSYKKLMEAQGATESTIEQFAAQALITFVGLVRELKRAEKEDGTIFYTIEFPDGTSTAKKFLLGRKLDG